MKFQTREEPQVTQNKKTNFVQIVIIFTTRLIYQKLVYLSLFLGYFIHIFLTPLYAKRSADVVLSAGLIGIKPATTPAERHFLNPSLIPMNGENPRL
jgi:hypothetical protein